MLSEILFYVSEQLDAIKAVVCKILQFPFCQQISKFVIKSNDKSS